MPYYIFLLASRFSQGTKYFLSGLSAITILGLTLGITILITVISVFNGFNKDLLQALIPDNNHISITLTEPNISNKNITAYIKYLKKIPEINKITTKLEQETLLDLNNHKKLVIAEGSESVKDKYAINLSQDIAENFDINLGDPVYLYSPKINFSIIGPLVRFKKFTTANIIYNNFNKNIVYINQNTAKKLFGLSTNINKIYIALFKTKDTARITKKLQQISAKFFNTGFKINNWQQANKSLLHAINLEKVAIILVLSLIAIVAVFNILSILLMLFYNKKREIGLLISLGLNKNAIFKIFITHAIYLNFIAIILSLLLFIPISYYLPNNHFLQLPIEVISFDIILIFSISLLLTVIVSIYPAWQARNIMPLEVLAYDE